jgi:hypothetical protein
VFTSILTRLSFSFRKGPTRCDDCHP